MIAEPQVSLRQPAGCDVSYAGVRVAVLGASGFIGQWVAHALCAAEANLCLLVRNRAAGDRILADHGIRGDVIELDLRDLDATRAVLRTVRPAITFNLAGYGVDRSETDAATAYQINADLVAGICEVLAEARDPEWLGLDLVHVGSALEYGSVGGDLSEDSLPSPTTLYGQSKLAGTEALTRRAAAGSIKAVTARLFTVYGPGEHTGRLLPSLLETAATGTPLALTSGGQRRDFTYVEDVAEGLLRLGVRAAHGGCIVNLATGRLVTVRRFAETAARILSIPTERLRFGAIATRHEEMQHDPVNITRLRSLTGWVPKTTIETGIRKTRDFVAERAAGGD